MCKRRCSTRSRRTTIAVFGVRQRSCADTSTSHCSLKRVARVAGFAPTYFSSIFAKTEKTTLARYIRRLRVDRAKRMLDSTVLGVERIGQLCGFRTRTSFHHAFQELVGKTPGDYRARAPRIGKIATLKH